MAPFDDRQIHLRGILLQLTCTSFQYDKSLVSQYHDFLECLEMEHSDTDKQLGMLVMIFFLTSGGRFSKAPKTFRAHKAIAKSRTLRVQSCIIHIF